MDGRLVYNAKVQTSELPSAEVLNGELNNLAGLATKFFFGFDATKETPEIQLKSPYAPMRIGEAFHIFSDSSGDFAVLCAYHFKDFIGDNGGIVVVPVDRQKTNEYASKENLYLALLITGTEENAKSSPDDIGMRFNSMPFQKGTTIHVHGDIQRQLKMVARAKEAMQQKPPQFDYCKQEDWGQLR